MRACLFAAALAAGGHVSAAPQSLAQRVEVLETTVASLLRHNRDLSSQVRSLEASCSSSQRDKAPRKRKGAGKGAKAATAAAKPKPKPAVVGNKLTPREVRQELRQEPAANDIAIITTTGDNIHGILLNRDEVLTIPHGRLLKLRTESGLVYLSTGEVQVITFRAERGIRDNWVEAGGDGGRGRKESARGGSQEL
jgi:hypothetical protein